MVLLASGEIVLKRWRSCGVHGERESILAGIWGSGEPPVGSRGRHGVSLYHSAMSAHKTMTLYLVP